MQIVQPAATDLWVVLGSKLVELIQPESEANDSMLVYLNLNQLGFENVWEWGERYLVWGQPKTGMRNRGHCCQA